MKSDAALVLVRGKSSIYENIGGRMTFSRQSHYACTRGGELTCTVSVIICG